MSSFAAQSGFRRCGFALALVALLASVTGCVQRRFTIRSNPPGAQVYVDDYEIGVTPVSHDFVFYGTRKIRLVKDGYETLTVFQPMPTPWYQWPGLDFFSENIWPHEIRDEHSFSYQMVPTIEVPAEQLVSRAEQLRSASRVLPATAVQPVVLPPPEALPAPAALPPYTLPPNTLPPPGSFPPSAIGAPAPGYLPPPTTVMPPTGAAPSYGPPGGGYLPGSTAPMQTPAPGYSVPPPGTIQPGGTIPNYAPPGAYPSVPVLPSQPALPPDWRPMTDVPKQSVQR
jgi:hypothetical protein